MRSTILRSLSRWRPVALAVAMIAGAPGRGDAHEIPSKVTVLAFVKPDATRLRVVIRVPLGSMRDIEWPERPLGYLDLAKAHALTQDAARLWIADYLDVYENGTQLQAPRILGTRISLPSDRAFTSYETALGAALGPPLATSTDVPWNQTSLDVVLDYAITSPASSFSVRPHLARLGVTTTTVLHYMTGDGNERVYQYRGDPGLVRLDPRWFHAAWQFVKLGVGHILGGIDHLLFVFCLVIPFRRFRSLIVIVTAFTIAHSITLASASLGVVPDALWFPPLIETLVAASILYMAIENVLGPKIQRRWLVAFGFGLVHGFAFSFALKESLQFAGSHLAVSLFTFNLGVEIGQVLVLAIAVPLVSLLFTRVVAERIGIIILSAFVAHTAWHWMTERGSTLSEYEFAMPVMDLAFAASAIRAAIVLLIAGGAVWGMRGLVRRIWLPAVALAMFCFAGDAAAQTKPVPPAIRTTRSGVFSKTQATRGADVYAGYCKTCHTAQPHTGAMFNANWKGRPLSDLFVFMRDRMPKNDPASLSAEEYADVLAYVLQMNRMPAGATDLPPDSTLLSRIRIAPTVVPTRKDP